MVVIGGGISSITTEIEEKKGFINQLSYLII